MQDLYNNLSITQAALNAKATANVTSNAIDMQGFDSLAVVFDIGDSGDTLSGSTYWTLKLQHSDDDSVYTDCAGADLLGGMTTVVIDAPSEDSLAVKFGYVGGKRYVKGLAVKTGTHTNGTNIGVLALRGHAALAPV